MKQLTDSLLLSIKQSHGGFNTKPCKWDTIFDTEYELIEAMFHEKIHTNEDKVPMHKWCKGYEYIKGFRKYYRQYGNLTESQIRQLKRMAYEIAYHIYCVK